MICTLVLFAVISALRDKGFTKAPMPVGALGSVQISNPVSNHLAFCLPRPPV